MALGIETVNTANVLGNALTLSEWNELEGNATSWEYKTEKINFMTKTSGSL